MQATLDFTSEQLKDAEDCIRTAKEEMRKVELNLQVSNLSDLQRDEWFRYCKIGMYRISIRYPVSAGYLTIRYYPDLVK